MHKAIKEIADIPKFVEGWQNRGHRFYADHFQIYEVSNEKHHFFVAESSNFGWNNPQVFLYKNEKWEMFNFSRGGYLYTPHKAEFCLYLGKLKINTNFHHYHIWNDGSVEEITKGEKT